MKNIFIKSIVAIFVAVVLVGCGTAHKVQTFDNSNFFAKAKTKSKIERAIKMGAANKGWQTKKIKDGLIQANILVRSKYFVSVDINYDSKGYTINYKKSRNLKYDPKTQEIHRSYNKWVKILQDNINFQLDSLDMSSATNNTAPIVKKKLIKKQTV